MAKLTTAFGAALVLTGLIAYFATGAASFTPLIPAFVGAPVLAAGLVATRPGWHRHGIYAASALGLLLAVGTLRGAFGLAGGEVSVATVLNTALLAASVGFVVLCARNLRGGTQNAR